MQVESKALYVRIYDELYKKIKNQVYQESEKIPSEQDLANEFQVSRSTIREALLLLRENGLIYNIKGFGNFISKNSSLVSNGLEKLLPIPQSYSVEPLKAKVIERRFEVITEYSSEILGAQKGSLILSHHTVFYNKGEKVAYSLYMVPTELFSDNNIDLGDNDAIDNFVFNLHKLATRSNAHLVMSKSGNFLQRELDLPLDTDILLIDEVYFNERGSAIASLRHSMLPEHFNYEIVRV